MNRILFIFFILLLSPVYISASIPLKSLLQTELLEKLQRENTITETLDKNKNFTLLPEHKELSERIQNIRKELNPTVIVETLNLYEKKTYESWSEKDKLTIYNGILALSTLEGLEYFSKTKGKMRKLYEKSTLIDNPENKKELNDAVVTDLPEELTIFAKQKDTTFGENIYRYDYYAGDELLTIVQRNITPIRYGIVSVADKNKLASVVTVIDTDEYLLIYAVSLADVSSFSLFGKRMKESFSNRTNALMRWFSDKADAVYSTNH